MLSRIAPGNHGQVERSDEAVEFDQSILGSRGARENRAHPVGRAGFDTCDRVSREHPLPRLEDLALRFQGIKEAVAGLEDLNQDHGIRKSKGSITIKITLDRDDGIYRVGIDSTTKLPNVPAAKEVFWVTPDNGLVQQDPRQLRMGFDVARTPTVVRDAL